MLSEQQLNELNKISPASNGNASNHAFANGATDSSQPVDIYQTEDAIRNLKRLASALDFTNENHDVQDILDVAWLVGDLLRKDAATITAYFYENVFGKGAIQ